MSEMAKKKVREIRIANCRLDLGLHTSIRNRNHLVTVFILSVWPFGQPHLVHYTPLTHDNKQVLRRTQRRGADGDSTPAPAPEGR